MYDADLRLAHALADAADEITLARFGAADLQVATKVDHSPVTDADHAVEQAARALLAAKRPGDAVLGEERGETDGYDDRRWIVDPIDGTKNYVRGVPVWATLLALEQDGALVVGVVSAPALARRWWASRDGGAWTGPSSAQARRCRVSAVSRLSQAFLSYSSLTGWESSGRLTGFLELTRRVSRSRAFGDFWSHMLVAEGAVDVSCEPEVSLWDVAAVAVIVAEAGGTCTDLGGVPRPEGGSVLCSNGALHEETLALLRR